MNDREAKKTGEEDSVGQRPLRSGTQRFATGYQAGLEAVASLAIAIVAGAWLDARLETAPLFLLVGTILGFGSCGLRLWRYQRSREAEDESEGNGESR
jgi:F0F1-type ATP synthase assembly protein I